MKTKLRIILQAMVLLALGTLAEVKAQQDYVPPLSGSVLTSWQIQGEYFGTIENGGGNLGAWVVSKGGSNYSVTFLPGGLLTIPGQPNGGWNQTGWNPTTFTGNAVISGTTFNVTTGSNYKAATLTGSGEDRTLTGVTPSGVAFSLKRVKRNSTTFGLKPKAEWGTAKMWFDSATGSADLAKWERVETTPNLSRNYLDRGVKTKEFHGAGFLHLEFLGCFNPTATAQGRSNSGVYLQANYEAQVLDSFGRPIAIDEFGAIYTVKAPPFNASLPPLTWHTYDIYFTPRTGGTAGSAVGAATMTVYANGVLVQDATPVPRETTAPKGGSLLADGPLYLQNHGSIVVYNNIWFIPNATVSSLPYETVIRDATTGLAPHTIQPHRERISNGKVDLNRWFDVSGRNLRSGNSVLSIQPAFLSPAKP